jgi:hypothetical protein
MEKKANFFAICPFAKGSKQALNRTTEQTAAAKPEREKNIQFGNRP